MDFTFINRHRHSNLPIDSLDLADDSSHIWIADLRPNACGDLGQSNTLSRDERERAKRFRFERDRDQYANCRIILRRLISGYTGLEPRAISFEYSQYGKPQLSDHSSQKNLQFNVSHSGSYALFAFSNSFNLGIDVERIKPTPDLKSIARSHFSTLEYDQITQSNGSEMELFYNCWTRKEAVVKAIGKGLSLPLESFSVETRSFPNGAKVQVSSHDATLPQVSLYNLDFGIQGYASALAVLGEPEKLRFFEYGTR